MVKHNKKAAGTAMKAKSVGGKGPDDEKKLKGLASDIRAGHRQCLDAMKGVIEQARDIGKHLIAAKKLVQHGGWIDWVESNCKFAMRMAQNYMLVARHYNGVLAKCRKADEWRLTEFLAVAQELDWKRRGKAKKTAKPDLFAVPTVEVARRQKKLRHRNAAGRVRKETAVTEFVRQKLDSLYAAVRRFAASKEAQGLVSEGIEAIDVGVLLVESLKAGLNPAGLAVAVPSTAKSAHSHRHPSNGRHHKTLAA